MCRGKKHREHNLLAKDVLHGRVEREVCDSEASQLMDGIDSIDNQRWDEWRME